MIVGLLPHVVMTVGSVISFDTSLNWPWILDWLPATSVCVICRFTTPSLYPDKLVLLKGYNQLLPLALKPGNTTSCLPVWRNVMCTQAPASAVPLSVTPWSFSMSLTWLSSVTADKVKSSADRSR